MADSIVRGLVRHKELLIVAAEATDAARLARERHGLAPSSSALLGEGLLAGALIAALQKAEGTRLNLQVECDGPAQGLFVDADTFGRVRGYVKNKAVRFPPAPRFSTKPLFGASGFVSVLRDVDGVFYRGAVGLEHRELAQDLEHYFTTSEQLDTAVALEVLADGDEELGWVGGLLVQKLPDASDDALDELRARVRSGALEQAGRGRARSPEALIEALFGPNALEISASREVTYFCPCTRERVLRALQAFPNGDLFEMIHQDKKAEVDCHFCGQHYLVTPEELQRVLDLVDQRDVEEEEGSLPESTSRPKTLH